MGEEAFKNERRAQSGEAGIKDLLENIELERKTRTIPSSSSRSYSKEVSFALFQDSMFIDVNNLPIFEYAKKGIKKRWLPLGRF